ncbi:MAG: carbonic anhydrase family protein [Myxococcales bacterium]|nr:carbonic anhydrase family protein [Myxococcales bacterium]
MRKHHRYFASFAALTLLTVATACKRESRGAKVEPPQAAEQESAGEGSAMPGLDHGLLQSPINILSNRSEAGHHQIAVNLHHAEPEYMENRGHTIELDFPRGSTITFDGREYELKQLHFHTPSEHQIDGITYPMELHVVNLIEPKTPDDPPGYLVLGFLYRMGDEDPFITSFLDQIPTEEGREALEPRQVHVTVLDRTLDFHFYHYRGSLTTPPYTETVEWMIAKEIQQASPKQVRRIHQIEGDNARHVQPMYGRTVDQ